MYRHVGIAAAAILSAVPMLAQAQQRYEPQPPPQQQQQLTFPDRFAAANATNDGCLTLQQARRGLPGVAKEFPQIDVERRGCVTLAEVRDFRRSQLAGQQQEPPPEQPQPQPPPQRQPPPPPPQVGPNGLPPPPAGY
jgi:hypothetical protein